MRNPSMECEVECTAQYSKLDWQRTNNFDKTCQDCNFNRISSDGVVAVENGDSVISFTAMSIKKTILFPFSRNSKSEACLIFAPHQKSVADRVFWYVPLPSSLIYYIHYLSCLWSAVWVVEVFDCPDEFSDCVAAALGAPWVFEAAHLHLPTIVGRTREGRT